MSSTQQLLLGEGAGGSIPVYIEDVFSTWLYIGNGSTRNIVNGIDLSTKGGLVWTKTRSSAVNHALVDTVRGPTQYLISNNASSNTATEGEFTGFTSTGYGLNSLVSSVFNGNNITYVSWTFREQPKFFDIVTYTGNGAAGRQISHNLGSTPGCIIVKTTTGGNGWNVWHTELGGNDKEILLNSTNASTSFGYFGGAPTSTTFTVDGAVGNGTNTNGETFIAYLFANNAGGFGLTGTDNVISCGSFTTDGSGGATVSLGYEPQWVMTKSSSTTSDWRMFDNMRGLSMASDNLLRANTSGAESTGDDYINPTATGFVIPAIGSYSASQTFIYIAIRRGPMKVPTVGTSVFSPVLTSSASETVNTVGFTPDMQLIKQTGNAVGTNAVDRLRGASTRYQFNDGQFLLTSSTAAESSNYSTQYWNNTGFSTPFLTAGISTIYWTFRRAPSFFDEVCWTGNSSGTFRTISHGLSVAPELIIYKRRDATSDWNVYHSSLGNNAFMQLNTTGGVVSPADLWNYTTPTSTSFTVGYANTSPRTYVAYLFATCAGVSKVGSYTGTASTQTINCGFTGGARFVLIKRTDTAGYGWYVWDTARGMVSGTDPHLKLNDTDPENNVNWVYSIATGFQIVTTDASVNANGGTYIFLAIA